MTGHVGSGGRIMGCVATSIVCNAAVTDAHGELLAPLILRVPGGWRRSCRRDASSFVLLKWLSMAEGEPLRTTDAAALLHKSSSVMRTS